MPTPSFSLSFLDYVECGRILPPGQASSSKFYKADLSESFYNEAEEFKRLLLSNLDIDVLKCKVVRPVKPF